MQTATTSLTFLCGAIHVPIRSYRASRAQTPLISLSVQWWSSRRLAGRCGRSFRAESGPSICKISNRHTRKDSEFVVTITFIKFSEESGLYAHSSPNDVATDCLMTHDF